MENNWLKRDKDFVWHPFTQMKTAAEPLVVVKAKDALLYTENNVSYIDANSSWWVNVHGHGNAHISAAVYEQMKQLDHVIFAGVTHPQAIQLAERMCKLLKEPFEKVFFSDNGSTAIEVALKMVFQYWHNLHQPKKRIVAMEGAYHGDTFGAMAVGQRGVFNEPFEHFFFDVDFISFPDNSQNEQNALNQAELVFKTGDCAALIIEPLVQGSAGMRIYSAAFLEKLFVLAKKHNVLIIADEIMTGWGRTGKMFAINAIETHPDIICLSKGLTGGTLPLGLTVTTNEIFEAFLDDSVQKALLHGHSYTGNPVVCAAANASLDLFEQQEVWSNIERISSKHDSFKDALVQFNHVVNVQQLGTIIRFELKQSENTSYFSSIRDKAYNYFIEKQCLIRPLGNVLFLNPPYCITNEQLEYLYETILDFIASIKD